TNEVDTSWRLAHCHIANELQAPHLIALDAGHRINDEAPGLVALAVDAVVSARDGQRPQVDPRAVAAARGRIKPCDIEKLA
ncbi:MAG TPA: hypothetical protein VFY84_09230, partial [Jiangellales bacterium]|nr:hypothetical protein [Jiangellales bacterium]